MHPWHYDDDEAWRGVDPDDAWIFDKLILAKKLGYSCGPVGVDVSKPGKYIVRPCVNFHGMGLGAMFVHIENTTANLPSGSFWCEIFKGRHLSVDYEYGKQILCVEGIKGSFLNTEILTKWEKWKKVDVCVDPPDVVGDILTKYKYSNCEFINGNLIEVHLRRNPNFYYAREEYIPVYNRMATCPDGYRFIEDPDCNGIRVGAFIR